ncbi:glycosyltransferase [Psychromicrobium sp. YIM B11713]|uniref:glycosyltransferase n=1 Tax=Psychromicrobium sp. YIM B11713 TaxID=3145233 RepID=UPI00374FA79B
MRILHVVNDAQTGGAQTLIEALGRQKNPADEIHLLVLMGEGSLSPRFAEIADTVSYVGMSRRDIIPLRAIRTLRRIIREQRIDLVHSHLMQSDLMSLLTPGRAIRVSTVHSSASYETRGASHLVRRLVAKFSGRFDAVVACSPSALEYIRSLGYHLEPSVILNGTQLGDWSAENGAESQRFVHLGRWHVVKDHNNLFAALSLLLKDYPEAKLDCAGLGLEADNPEVAELLQRHKLSEEVTLHGSVSNVKLLFDESRAMVISSSHEALPMSGIEALSSGLPVVTTNVGDCPELAIGPEYLVERSNPEQLAAAMRKTLELSSREYRRSREEARARAEERFDERVTAQNYRKLYESLLPSS